MKIAVNEFVRRQTKGTGKTYSASLTFEEVAQDAEKQMANGHFKEGYRDGVRIVEGSVELVHQFVCPFVKLDENTGLVSKLVQRRSNEEFYICLLYTSPSPRD